MHGRNEKLNTYLTLRIEFDLSFADNPILFFIQRSRRKKAFNKEVCLTILCILT